MSRKTWALILALVGGGVVLQIPAHSGMVMPDFEEAEDAEIRASVAQGTTRVDLEVTGMT